MIFHFDFRFLLQGNSGKYFKKPFENQHCLSSSFVTESESMLSPFRKQNRPTIDAGGLTKGIKKYKEKTSTILKLKS